jgi:threonine/homoserine/homoserine lactone efflux protein
MIPGEIAVFLAFVPAVLAPKLTPGADMAFCLAQGIRSGSRAAMGANAGIAAGCMVRLAWGGGDEPD